MLAYSNYGQFSKNINPVDVMNEAFKLLKKYLTSIRKAKIKIFGILSCENI